MSKVPKDVKKQIMEMFKEGHTIAEVRARFPEANGQSVAGLYNVHQRLTGAIKPLRTAPQAQPGGFDSGSTNPVTKTAAPTSPGFSADQVAAAQNTGFTPAGQTSQMPSGFTPAYAESFVIKKMDPPNTGIIGEEHPPFTMQDFINRYEPGSYEIWHYRNGTLFKVYRETISSGMHGKNTVSGSRLTLTGNSVQNPNSAKEDPVRVFSEAVRTFHTISRDADAAAERKANLVETRRERQEARKEASDSAAIQGLVNLATQKKDDGSGDKMLFTLMENAKAERDASEDRHRRAMEYLEKQHELALQRERERLAAEKEVREKDMEMRGKREEEHTRLLRELDNQRQQMWMEHYNKMIEELNGTREAIVEDMETRRKHVEDMMKMRLEHTDQIISMKREMGGNSEEMEKQKMIWNALTGFGNKIISNVERIANSKSQKAEGSNMGGGRLPEHSREPKLDLRGARYSPEEDRDEGQETSLNTVRHRAPVAPPDVQGEKPPSLGEQAMSEPWFQRLIRMVCQHIKKKLPGDLIGGMFIDEVNKDPARKVYFNYLVAEEHSRVLKDLRDALEMEQVEILESDQGVRWFEEFQGYLLAALQNTQAAARRMEEEEEIKRRKEAREQEEKASEDQGLENGSEEA